MKAWIDRTLNYPCDLLASWGVHPNLVTFIGLLVTLMVPFSILQEQWVSAGLWLLFAGFFDVLDGALARNKGLKGPFGAFWDSTLDRLSEAVVFAGFLLYYYQHQNSRALLLAFVVCILSFMVSYTRARAEGLGIQCEVGILPRPGRVILLALGFFFARPTLALGVVGVLSFVTVLQRIYCVWNETQKKKRS